MELREYWIQQVGENWYDLLRPFLYSNLMKEISNTIKKEREKFSVLPKLKDRDLIFKAFRDLQPSKIKVIILGQDIYPQPEVFSGYAFCNKNVPSICLNPSLKNIFNEIYASNTYIDNRAKDDIEYRKDLSRWVDQGVFLINTALTVRENNPGTHLLVWKRFTTYWIRNLSKTFPNVIWVLWGKQAQGFIPEIKTGNIIITSHPSPLGYDKTNHPFKGSGCFNLINNILTENNLEKIQW